jgi:hypothetical protein
VARISQQAQAFALARRGVYREKVKQALPNGKHRPLGAAMRDVEDHLRQIRLRANPVAPDRAPLPASPKMLSRHVKMLGYFLGADAWGICRVPLSAVYLDREDGTPLDGALPLAIVLVKRKHLGSTHASNGYDWIFDTLSHQTYQLLALWSETMADYLRRLGYAAEASNLQNYQTLLPPLLLAAGIGEVSRMGIVVNPFFGANFKAAAVLSDLPLQTDQPRLRSAGFCEGAPSALTNALAGHRRGGKTLYNGYETGNWTCAGVFPSRPSTLGGTSAVAAPSLPWNRPDRSPTTSAPGTATLAFLFRSVEAQAERLPANRF